MLRSSLSCVRLQHARPSASSNSCVLWGPILCSVAAAKHLVQSTRQVTTNLTFSIQAAAAAYPMWLLQQQNHQAGTFPYAAPELLLGRPCTLSADIYSLGVLLHEMITRLPPQRGYMRCVLRCMAPLMLQSAGPELRCS